MASERYFKVGPSIWRQPWDDTTRTAAFYLLTCEHRVTEGLYRLPLEYAATDLGWPLPRFRKAFDELLADGFVEYDAQAQVVLIVNALRWQSPQNPNQARGAVNALRELPPTVLFTRLHSLAQRFSQRFAEELEGAFPQRIAHPPSSSSNSQEEAHGAMGVVGNGKPPEIDQVIS